MKGSSLLKLDAYDLLSWQFTCSGQPQTLRAIVNAVKMRVKVQCSRKAAEDSCRQGYRN